MQPQSITDILISSSSSTPLQNLPHWFNFWYSTDPTTGSLLRRFISPQQAQLLVANYYASKIENRAFFDYWLGEPSRGWYASTNLLTQQINSIVIYYPSGSISPIRSSSDFDFIDYVVPVWDLSDSTVYFRNLNNKTISVSGFGIFNLSDLLPGQDIYYSGDNTHWLIIDAHDSRISNNLVSVPLTGFVSFIYPSQSLNTYLVSGYVSINNGPRILLNQFDFWNSLDEFGLVVDLYRFPNEDNVSYWKRLQAVFPFTQPPTEQGLQLNIANRLGLLKTGFWDGISTINFGASSNIYHLWINSLPEYSFLIERMKNIGTTYFTSKPDIRSPYIFDGGVLITTSVPSGRIVDPIKRPNGLIANYKYYNYSLTFGTSGLTTLTRTQNTSEQIHELSWLPEISVNTLNKRSYKNSVLLNPDGTPTVLFRNIANEINTKVARTYNYTKWGQIHFFLNDELSPELDYIPELYDV